MSMTTLLQRLFSPPIETEPDDFDDSDELDVPTYLRRHWADAQVDADLEMETRSGLRRVSARPLDWTLAPPRRPGNYYVRRPGQSEYITLRVDPGYEYGPGMEWAGPLPEPPP